MRRGLSLAGAILLAGCASTGGHRDAPLWLDLALRRGAPVAVTYRQVRPGPALHFAQALGGYRAQDWHVTPSGFRWVTERDGERLERVDGQSFASVAITMPLRYRALPKSYAPFSPFSEGSALIHSGQFHACLSAPCEGISPLPITIVAPGKTIGVNGRRHRGRARFVSHDEGTNIFVGTLAPVAANGFVAIVDPGLPEDLRAHLHRSLPRAIDDFAQIYGPLSFHPELYVSIDARPRADGHESTQGGTLPNQIFMHFDGPHARERVTQGSPYWLDWFFAHEAAHLFQQDKSGQLAGDDQDAWIHEGGADAMAAFELAARGTAERAYVEGRVRDAENACAAGLAKAPLGRATANGDFDLHYQCGLLIWSALDRAVPGQEGAGLHALNRVFFASVRGGAPWTRATFIATLRASGVDAGLVVRIERLVDGGYSDAKAELAGLTATAEPVRE